MVNVILCCLYNTSVIHCCVLPETAFRHPSPEVLPRSRRSACGRTVPSSLCQRTSPTSTESTLTEKHLLTFLESTLTELLNLKPFRINTYIKIGGKGHDAPKRERLLPGSSRVQTDSKPVSPRRGLVSPGKRCPSASALGYVVSPLPGLPSIFRSLAERKVLASRQCRHQQNDSVGIQKAPARAEQCSPPRKRWDSGSRRGKTPEG
jgi:hypothetical protein